MVRPKSSYMKMITLYMPKAYIEALDKMVKAGLYGSRAEAIRAGVKDLLDEELKLIVGKGGKKK